MRRLHQRRFEEMDPDECADFPKIKTRTKQTQAVKSSSEIWDGSWIEKGTAKNKPTHKKNHSQKYAVE